MDHRDVAGPVAREALVHTLAREKRAHGMRVNIAVPGLAEGTASLVTVVRSPVRVIRSLLRPAGR